MSGNPKLEMILERVGQGSTPDDFALWACRGAGRGCKRNTTREKKVHCDDCVPCDDPEETLEHLTARLARGDA